MQRRRAAGALLAGGEALLADGRALLADGEALLAGGGAMLARFPQMRPATPLGELE